MYKNKNFEFPMKEKQTYFVKTCSDPIPNISNIYVTDNGKLLKNLYLADTNMKPQKVNILF